MNPNDNIILAEIGSQPQTPVTVDASNQDGVEGSHELLQICKDVVSVDEMNLPSASPEKDIAVNFSNCVNVRELLFPSFDDLGSCLESEEREEKSHPHELCETVKATSLSGEDILPGKPLVKVYPQFSIDAKVGSADFKVPKFAPIGSTSVVTEQNSVLQKLLWNQRRWRYFDSGNVNFRLEGHAVKCPAQNRKKPCYVCGDAQHTGKKCRKRRTCFTCNGKGHIAEDCPKSDPKFDICLRCAELGHDLFSCSNDYPLDDLKKVQCYICNEVGHLCCVSSGDVNSATISCYNCGDSAHSGLECPKPRLDKCSSRPPSICYKCGEQGHVGRVCTIGNTVVCATNPKSAVLNPETSKVGQDESGVLDLAADTNDAGVYQSRGAVRRSKRCRHGRVKKQKMKGFVNSIVG